MIKLIAYLDGDAVLNSDPWVAAAQPEHFAVAHANHKDVVGTKGVDPWSGWVRKLKQDEVYLHGRF